MYVSVRDRTDKECRNRNAHDDAVAVPCSYAMQVEKEPFGGSKVKKQGMRLGYARYGG